MNQQAVVEPKLNGTKTNEKLPTETKPKQTKTAVIVPFPLPMDEARAALSAFIRDRYGLALDVSTLRVQGDELIVTGEAKAK